MKVFVDANILVATLNKEYPLFTSPLCLAIAFYFSGKRCCTILAKQKIEILCKHISVTSVNEDLTKKALINKKINDFEDGLEYYSAVDSKCDFIITEDRNDFFFSEIEVVGCEEFLQRITPQT